jgi:hypothetical protein
MVGTSYNILKTAGAALLFVGKSTKPALTAPTKLVDMPHMPKKNKKKND